MLAGQGWGAWPECSRKAGARGTVATPRAVRFPVAPQTSAPQQAAAPAVAPPGGPRIYQVRAGDTLSGIAAAQGVTGGWRAIYDGNRTALRDANVIRPGQQLTLG